MVPPQSKCTLSITTNNEISFDNSYCEVFLYCGKINCDYTCNTSLLSNSCISLHQRGIDQLRVNFMNLFI